MYRIDPITGSARLVAPGRAARFRAAPHQCPFCPGSEAHTPEQTGVIESADGWAARSFPNRYPLTDAHEVLVPSPRHITSWRELTLPELIDAVSLLLERHAALQAPGRYVHAFVNDGSAAGASLPHVHAQLVQLEAGEATERLTYGVRSQSPGGCALCALLESDLVIERGNHHVLVAHPVPRLAGGLLLAPTQHVTAPRSEHRAEFAALLHRALQAADPGALNMWFVQDAARAAHWYVELQPRSANLAGVELALGLNVSASDAMQDSQSARERLALHS